MGSSPEPGDDILDISQLNFDGDFETQVTHLLRRVRLSREDVVNLQQLLVDLEMALQNEWPGCEVHPFGSIVTGLGIRTSDVDCYVHIPYPTSKRSLVMVARNILRKIPWKFRNLFAIPSATVPILKFYHPPTNCNCDVSFKSPSGIRNSKLISQLLCADTRALPLAVVVKYWSKVYHFTGTNLMPNYALVMMVIFYLQQKRILPPVVELQRHIEPLMIDYWDTAFDECFSMPFSNNNETLYDLLGGFFQYYATFNYERYMIAPFIGSPINRELFYNLNSVPQVYSLYKANVVNNVCREIRLDTVMSIQDPFNHSRNCAVAIFPKLFHKIVSHFQFAARMFETKDPDDFLTALFTQDPLRLVVVESVYNNHNNNKNNIKKPKAHVQYKQKFKKNIKNYIESMKTKR